MPTLAKLLVPAALCALLACRDDGEAVVVAHDDASAATATDGSVPVADAAPPIVQFDAGFATLPSNKTGCDAIEMAAPSDGVQLELPLPVPAAQEREYCMLVLASQDTYVNWTDGRFTKGSHHGNIYRTGYRGTIPTTTVTGGTIADPTKPHPCPTPQQVWDTRGGFGTGR
ncbi:MAG: hypothetical protein RLZZ450_5219, partial [Pseudomonadota bacterium]